MDSAALKQSFARHRAELNHFERIAAPLHPRPDVCAFLMLDRLLPGTARMVATAEQEVIYLSVDLAEFAAVATEDTVRDLVRCGVTLCRFVGALRMSV